MDGYGYQLDAVMYAVRYVLRSSNSAKNGNPRVGGEPFLGTFDDLAGRQDGQRQCPQHDLGRMRLAARPDRPCRPSKRPASPLTSMMCYAPPFVKSAPMPTMSPMSSARCKAFYRFRGSAAREIVFELTGAHEAELVAFRAEAGLFQSIGMSADHLWAGVITKAHRPDENVELTQLRACLKMIYRLRE